jgi:hypothetical protein
MRDPISDAFHCLTFRTLYAKEPVATSWGAIPIRLFLGADDRRYLHRGSELGGGALG